MYLERPVFQFRLFPSFIIGQCKSLALRRIKVTSKNRVAHSQFKRSLNIAFPGWPFGKSFPLSCFSFSFSTFLAWFSEPDLFLGSPLKGLKFKHYTKSLVASKWHDPRYDLVSDFLLVSGNKHLVGLKLGGFTIVTLNNLHNKANQQR